jgi:hypothetical protein
MIDSIPYFLKICLENQFILRYFLLTSSQIIPDDGQFIDLESKTQYFYNFKLTNDDIFEELAVNATHLYENDLYDGITLKFKTISNKYFDNIHLYFGNITVYGPLEEVLADRRIVNPYRFIYANEKDSYNLSISKMASGTFYITVRKILNEVMKKIVSEEFILYSSQLKR